MKEIKKRIQVNIPFTMLHESYLTRFMEQELNPEIGFDSTALDRYSDYDFHATAELIIESGLTVTMHGPFMDLNPGSPDPEVRMVTKKRFQQLSKLIPIFKPKTVVCHSGWDERRYPGLEQTWIDHSVLFWRWFSERAGENRARIVLENVYESSPDQLMPLFDRLADYGVGFCLDTGHQSAFSAAPMSVWLERMEPHIAQLHLHDNHGLRDDHLALGKGVIDFPALFRFFEGREGSRPLITIEPHRDADLQPSLEYLEQHCPWLKD